MGGFQVNYFERLSSVSVKTKNWQKLGTINLNFVSNSHYEHYRVDFTRSGFRIMPVFKEGTWMHWLIANIA